MLKRFALLLCVLTTALTCPAPPVCPAAIAEEISEMPIATDTPYLDSQPELLRDSQKRLVTLGYLSGGADGIYGPMTADALRAFQGDYGLAQNSHLDQETLEALSRLVGTAASTTDIQRRLIDLGYLQGKADGYWGPRSEAATKAFQSISGLPDTGAADTATIDALFSGDAVALPEGLNAGDRGDPVVTLQQRLIQLGFLDGSADGAYGRQTAGAVTALQQHLIAQDCPVTANGVATPLTLFYLYNGDLPTYLHDVAPGTVDGEARRVETRLVSLGYMDATPDASFDDYAAEALMAFQADAQLNPTGVADADTFARLFSASAPTARRVVLHGIASGDRGTVVACVEQALLTGGMAIKLTNGRYDSDIEDAVARLSDYLGGDPATAALFSNRAHLSREAVEALLDGGLLGPGTGDTGNAAEAARIQRRLHTLFYLSRTGIDGRFGADSTGAIRAFQAANGLPETGETDPQTLAKLFSADAVAKSLPYRVEVSLAAQTVTVYRLGDQNEYEAVRSFSCSTGLHNTTPRGIFLDGFPCNRWHYFKKFDCWAQYSYDIEGNIMFHSVLYSDKDESTLRKGSVWALGSPASHGCIRLTVADAKWLYEHCPRGSLVIVID